jgi:hypothetical protein
LEYDVNVGEDVWVGIFGIFMNPTIFFPNHNSLSDFRSASFGNFKSDSGEVHSSLKFERSSQKTFLLKTFSIFHVLGIHELKRTGIFEYVRNVGMSIQVS